MPLPKQASATPSPQPPLAPYSQASAIPSSQPPIASSSQASTIPSPQPPVAPPSQDPVEPSPAEREAEHEAILESIRTARHRETASEAFHRGRPIYITPERPQEVLLVHCIRAQPHFNSPAKIADEYNVQAAECADFDKLCFPTNDKKIMSYAGHLRTM